MYQPSSRRFRPQTFESVCGQKAIVLTLKNALKFDRVAYAYLFCGSRGTGKTTLARLFAKALNCTALTQDQEPCNQCSSCLDIQQNRSLDLLEIDGASHRGIDDIRSINESALYSSSGKYKIYIIDEVHMLTKEAFNALLKTLEEPPSNVKFFFATTEPHKVLPTILSRCQRFDLTRLLPQEIYAKLKKITEELTIPIENEALDLISHLAEGGLRDAESLLDQLLCYAEPPITYAHVSQILGISPRSLFLQLDEAIEKQNIAFAFELAKEVFSQGKEFSYFLEGLIDHFRTHLLFKLNLDISFYLNHEDREKFKSHSSFYTEEHCFYILDFLLSWHKEISRIPFKRISLEMILLHLIRSRHRISLPSLIKRVEILQKTEKVPPVIKETVEEKKPPSECIKGKDDTLLRFAAVELEGIVKI